MMIKSALFLALFAITFVCASGQDATPTPEKQSLPVSGADSVPQEREKTATPKKPRVINGAAVNLPKPVYPRAARAERAAGKVTVSVLIDEEGKVVSATAAEGHPLLRAAAEDAAKRALFIPTTLDGKPVKVSGSISYNFLPEMPLNDSAMEIGAVISIIRANRPPEGVLMADILKGFPKKVPAELAVEPTLFEELAAAGETERAQVLLRISDAVKMHMTNEEKWHFEIGTHFANILIEIDRLSAIDDSSPPNPVNVKGELQQIKNLLGALPPESQPEIAGRFEHILRFEKSDLTDEARLHALWTAITALF